MADELTPIAPPEQVDPNASAQQEASGQGFATATEGFARGLTGGLSDLYLTKDLGVDPKYIQARQEANPVLSTVSGIAGSLPGLAALGPIEGVGANAALGAGMAGTGLVSDYALGDPDLNAEKILTHIGFGAALGAGIGKLMETGISSPISKALEKATGSETVQNLSKSDLAQGFMRGLEGLPETDIETPIRGMAKNLQDVYDTSGEAVKKMYKDAMASDIKQGLSSVPLETAQEHALNIYSKIEGVANELRGEEYTPVARKIFGNKVSDLQNDLLSAESSQEIYSTLNDFVKDFSGKSGLIKWSSTPSASDVATQDLLRGINREVRNALSDPTMWGEKAAGAYKSASDLFHELSSIKNDHGFDAAFTRQSPDGRIIDPSKVATFFKNYSAPGQDVKKQLLEDFFDVSKRIASASENYAGFEAAKDSIAGRFNALAKENEEMRSVADAMSRKGGNPHLPFGLEKFNPYNIGRTLNAGITGIKTAGKIVSDVGEAIAKGAQNVFKGDKPGIGTFETMSKSKYSKAVNQLQELSDPNQMINHMEKQIGPMQEALPNIAPFMQASVQRGLQFLASKIPQPTSQLPLDAEFEPTPSQISKFGEYYNAVNDPLSSLKEIKNGTLSNEAMETLNTVYPQLLHEMRVQLTENMGKKKNLNYATKISLAKFMGQPLDSSQTPQSMLANQAAMNSPVTQMSRQMSQGRPTVGGMKELKLSKNASTSLRNRISGASDE